MQTDTPLITQATLEEYGIEVAETETQDLLAHLNDTLHERVGTEITEYLNDTQLELLSELQETKSDDDVAEWLRENIENLDEIAQDEIDILLGELVASRDSVASAS